MRKIVAGTFITLDGVVEAPEKWNPPDYDDEMSQAVMPQLTEGISRPRIETCSSFLVGWTLNSIAEAGTH